MLAATGKGRPWDRGASRTAKKRIKNVESRCQNINTYADRILFVTLYYTFHRRVGIDQLLDDIRVSSVYMQAECIDNPPIQTYCRYK